MILLGGPGATVLLHVPLTDELKEAVRADIRAMSNMVEGDSFWIQKRPFLLSFDSPDSFDEDSPEILGWTPAGTIGLDACCNSDLDHRLLGQLCLHFARKLDGWIDFRGGLEEQLMGYLQGLPGRICTIPYVTGRGTAWASHICDADFFEAWLRRPGFCMIK